MDSVITTALANEARLQAVRQRVAGLQGEVKTGANLASIISSSVGDAARRLESAKAELAGMESGNGPGITDDFGLKSNHLDAFITAAVAAGLITDQAAARTLAGI